jgi:uncharacterized membrane protein
MDITGILDAIFRWLHVLAGITWIGHLYFFNWVNGPFQATIDGPTKKAVNPQLLPRALYWFRWGAAWTWITGVLLLLLVFYHGGLAVADGWSLGAVVMILVTFLAFAVYDAIAKSDLGKDNQTLAYIGLAATAVIILCFYYIGGFSPRGANIHTGALFGTTMAANVWMRIWPAQQKIISAVRDGNPPDAALVGMAGARSRHNVFMSIPLVYTMINAHTTALTMGGPIANTIVLVVVIGVGWLGAQQLYAKAGKVPGF